MKRVITISILIIFCFLLQTAVFRYFAFEGIVPNFLLVLTMSFGLMRGRKEGLLTGFFSGLLVDIFSGTVIGPYAFIYMTLGYSNGFFHKIYYVEDVILPMIMITVNDFIYNVVIYLVFFLLRNKLNFLGYLKNVILPEMVYTIIVTLLLYKVFMRINLALKNAVKKEEEHDTGIV